jgi:hypothetical protein
MTQRQDYKTVAPEAYAAMLGVETYVRKSGIEKPLLELVRTRASQINGYAYCLDMLLQDVELMPQHQDFGFKPSSRLETVAQHADEKEGNSEHPAIMF